MEEIILQWDGKVYHPHSPEDIERSQGFQLNKLLRSKITGAQDQRSLSQLNSYFVGCDIVAENNDDPNWQNKEDVDFQCRIEAKHFKKMVVIGNKVCVEVDSISCDNLKHIKANKYFDKGFNILSKKIGLTVDELFIAIRNRCGGKV